MSVSATLPVSVMVALVCVLGTATGGAALALVRSLLRGASGAPRQGRRPGISRAMAR